MVRTIFFGILLGTLSWSTAFSDTLQIDIDKSHVNWEGRKVSGAHNGTLQINAGEVVFEGDTLVSGFIVIDMNSIRVTDINNPEMNKRLERHLKHSDFFNVEEHAYSRFEFRKASILELNAERARYLLEGDLEIKGMRHPLNMKIWVAKGRVAASAEGRATVDRTLYDIRYKSARFFPGIGDRAIYDDFEISFDLLTRQSRNS